CAVARRGSSADFAEKRSAAPLFEDPGQPTPGARRRTNSASSISSDVSASDVRRRGHRSIGGAMDKQVVHTPKVPPARVPLSQASKAGGWVFASGQLGLDVATGKLVPGGIAAETRQVCENLEAVLQAAGSSLEKVVKVTIYMADLGELMAMNEVFSEYFRV